MSERFDREDGASIEGPSSPTGITDPGVVLLPPLTGVQKSVLKTADRGPLFAVGLGWRSKGGRTSFRSVTVASLAGRGYLRLVDGRAEITPAGRLTAIDSGFCGKQSGTV